MAGFEIFIILSALYFLPSIVAHQRHHRNFGPLLIVNAFLGITVIGWVATLAWAFTNQQPR